MSLQEAIGKEVDNFLKKALDVASLGTVSQDPEVIKKIVRKRLHYIKEERV